MKTCTNREECIHPNGPELSLDQFSNTKYSSDNLQSVCKECSKAYSKKYYAANKDNIKALRELNREDHNRYQRDYAELNKEKIAEYQSKWRKQNSDYHSNYYTKHKGA